MKYQLVYEYTITALENNVNELIKEGWRPQGGISSVNSVTPALAQAMIKDHTESPDKIVCG